MTRTQIRLLKQFLGATLIFAAVLVIFYVIAGRQIVERVKAEATYRQQYGADWKEHYSEERHVSVQDDHQKLLVATGGLVTLVLLCYLIYQQVIPRRSGRRRSRGRRQSFSLPT
ncbi:MAG: hypothetical protein P4L99_28665 [Chthoniobacter sp.]|nr:hypothetical protein [Chthoniobacter sp.]